MLLVVFLLNFSLYVYMSFDFLHNICTYIYVICNICVCVCVVTMEAVVVVVDFLMCMRSINYWAYYLIYNSSVHVFSFYIKITGVIYLTQLLMQ